MDDSRNASVGVRPKGEDRPPFPGGGVVVLQVGDDRRVPELALHFSLDLGLQIPDPPDGPPQLRAGIVPELPLGGDCPLELSFEGAKIRQLCRLDGKRRGSLRPHAEEGGNLPRRPDGPKNPNELGRGLLLTPCRTGQKRAKIRDPAQQEVLFTVQDRPGLGRLAEESPHALEIRGKLSSPADLRTPGSSGLSRKPFEEPRPLEPLEHRGVVQESHPGGV